MVETKTLNIETRCSGTLLKMQLLEFSFFTDTPIDFEFKKYSMLDYISKINKKYIDLHFSPYLLHNEKLYLELALFIDNLENMKNDLTNTRIAISENLLYYYYEKPETSAEIEEIERLIKWSKPHLWKSNMLGRSLIEDSGSLLW